MLTLFAHLKAFEGHIGIIQHNAIKSWMLLRPRPEIILFGNREGVKETADEFGLKHIPEVKRNESGVPLLNDIFHKAQNIAANRILCYANADMIFMSDFMKAVEGVADRKRRFLVMGIRHDLDVNTPLDFTGDWEERLRRRVVKDGRLYPLKGVDYFVFSQGLWDNIPPFYIGYIRWDNWLIYGARLKHVAVVDATPAVTAVHQNHGYAYGAGREVVWQDEHTKHNCELYGGPLAKASLFRYSDATHIFTRRGLKLALSQEYLKRHIVTIPIIFFRSRPFTWIIRRFLSAKEILLNVISNRKRYII